MQWRHRFYIILFINLLNSGFLQAQEVPKVLNFTKNDYRAQNQNWQITQSPDNEMFFGNGEGLMAYDGAFWRLFHLPNKQIVRSVAADKRGRIYVGGFAEFGYWERDATGNYQYHSLSQNIEFDRTKKEEIWHIIPHGDAVYFQSFSTIYRYDYRIVTVISPPGSIMFLQNIDGKLLFQGIDQGLFELTSDNNFRFIEKSGFLRGKVVSTILTYQNGFLVGTTQGGIFKYQGGEFTTWYAETQAISTDFQLNKGIKLSNGNYAFGTILNGLFILKPDGSTVYHISKENGLQNNTILSLFEDHAHNLWAGLDKGIDLLDLNTPLTFFQDKSGKIGAVYAAVMAHNRLYVGTNQGVFYKNEGSNFKLLNGLQGQVWDLKVFDNQLLCGHNSGTFIIKSDNSILKISDVTGGWCLVKHPSVSNVLVQGTYTGVAFFKKNTANQWQFWKKIPDFSEPIKKIAFDETGQLWALNAYNKIFKINLDKDLENTQNVIASDERQGGDIQSMKLPSGTKYNFNEIDNQLIFNSDNAFFTFKDTAFIPLSYIKNTSLLKGKFQIQEFLNGDFFKILDDNIELKYGEKTTKFRLKLIPDYETIIALDSSRYLFGLDDGYAIFDKNIEIPNAQFSPQPIIRLYTLDGLSYHYYPTDKKNNRYELPPQYRALRVDFALPYFTNTPQFQYATEQQNWSAWEETTSREFTNLPTGRQVFKLKNDITNLETAIEFDIKPYWYETKWAIFFYFLLLLGFVFLLRQYLFQQLEKQRIKMEADKQRELEKQRIESDNEKLHFEVINKSKKLANSTMNIIQKNEILIEIKDELNEMKKELGERFTEKHYSRLLHKIDSNMTSEESWRIFEDNFNEVHEDFLKRLKHNFPDLSPGDLKLAAYLRMNLSSKEISPLLFISVRSIENKRSRLRKKLGLKEEDNLVDFIIRF